MEHAIPLDSVQLLIPNLSAIVQMDTIWHQITKHALIWMSVTAMQQTYVNSPAIIKMDHISVVVKADSD